MHWGISAENNVFPLVFASVNLIFLSALAAKKKNLTESPTGPWWCQTYIGGHNYAMFHVQINRNN